jgi:hypothetical protein
MLDFDGDKLIDVIQSTSSGFYLWRNRGDGSWDGPFQAPLPPGATNISFTDPHVKLADMNGDRLLDLVYVRTGSVVYWPSLGWGQFGAPVEVANAPDPGLCFARALGMSEGQVAKVLWRPRRDGPPAGMTDWMSALAEPQHVERGKS